MQGILKRVAVLLHEAWSGADRLQEQDDYCSLRGLVDRKTVGCQAVVAHRRAGVGIVDFCLSYYRLPENLCAAAAGTDHLTFPLLN